MVCETSQPLVTLKFFCPVPVLSPISSVASSCLRRGGSQGYQEPVRPAGTPANRLCALSASAWTRGTQNSGLRTAGFCLSRPLLSCSQLQAIGLLCTKRLGRVAPLLGWGSGASYLGRTMLVYTTQWPPRRFDPWLVLGPEGMRTVTVHSEKSPCCISKSVWKLSCCSKVFQSVRMQHF